METHTHTPRNRFGPSNHLIFTPKCIHIPHHRRRIEELKAKEAATMQNLLATLGLKPGDRVTIPKRTEG